MNGIRFRQSNIFQVLWAVTATQPNALSSLKQKFIIRTPDLILEIFYVGYLGSQALNK